MKKLFSLLLCLALLLAFMPTALAADTGFALLEAGGGMTSTTMPYDADNTQNYCILGMTSAEAGWYSLDLTFSMSNMSTWWAYAFPVDAITEAEDGSIDIDPAAILSMKQADSFNWTDMCGSSLYFPCGANTEYYIFTYARDYEPIEDGEPQIKTASIPLSAELKYFAANVGDAGPNITSEYDATNNALLLKGTGSTWDSYDYFIQAGHLWNTIPTTTDEIGDLDGSVDKVIIGEGITHIGNGTFFNWTYDNENNTYGTFRYGDIIFPESLESIAEYALQLNYDTATSLTFLGGSFVMGRFFLYLQTMDPLPVYSRGWDDAFKAEMVNRTYSFGTTDALSFRNLPGEDPYDVNKDGEHNLKDVSALFHMLCSGEPYISRLDIDDDGALTLRDVMALYNALSVLA